VDLGTARRCTARVPVWPQFVQGSALHEAVEAGPGGSTFVDPATLPASTATAPLQTAPANNAAAA
jgi:hypothetical protein